MLLYLSDYPYIYDQFWSNALTVWNPIDQTFLILKLGMVRQKSIVAGFV